VKYIFLTMFFLPGNNYYVICHILFLRIHVRKEYKERTITKLAYSSIRILFTCNPQTFGLMALLVVFGAQPVTNPNGLFQSSYEKEWSSVTLASNSPNTRQDAQKMANKFPQITYLTASVILCVYRSHLLFSAFSARAHLMKNSIQSYETVAMINEMASKVIFIPRSSHRVLHYIGRWWWEIAGHYRVGEENQKYAEISTIFSDENFTS